MKVKFFVLLSFTLSILCTSCSRIKASLDVKKVVGKTIVLSDDIKYKQGYNPYYKKKSHLCGSILFWFDETECSLCRLSNLDFYKPFFEFCRDSVTCVDVRLVFSPSKDSKDLFMEFVDSNKFEYPIFIDNNNTFSKNNSYIPQKPMLHTFLLDSSGKVLLVGNPLMNEQIWSLYKSTMYSLLE